MRRIVPKEPSPMPGVCGTGHSFVQRSLILDALLEALVITARATPQGVELAFVPDAEVEGRPLPWMMGLVLGDLPMTFVTVMGPETRVLVPGAVSGESAVLRVSQGDVMKTIPITIAR